METEEQMGADFTKGNVTKKLLEFLIPFLLASMLNSIYNMVDMVVIGRFVGSAGTVAVSQGGKLLALFTNVSNGLAGGGQILIAQLLGAKKKDDLNSAIGTLFSELAIFALIVSPCCLIFAVQILTLLNTPAESFPDSYSYFVITSAGLPLVFGYNAISSILRGMGDSKKPLLFIAIAALVNLILDLVFVVGFHMGAAGTALATIISQGVAFGYSIAFLYRKRKIFGFDFKLKSFRIDNDLLKVMLRLGIPMASKMVMINVTQLFMISYINVFGMIQAAAYGIGDKIIQLTNIACQSTQQAGGAISAQNIGANRYDRAEQVVKSSRRITLTAAIILSTVSLLFPNSVFGLFTKDLKVLEYSKSFMRIAVLVYLLSAFSSSFATITIGTGNSKLSFLSGLVDGVIFRVGFCYLLGIKLRMGVTGFFLGNALARFGPLLVDGSYYLSGSWKRRENLVDRNYRNKRRSTE